jgi:hypothetical protein
MPVAIEVKSNDQSLKTRREALARLVLEQFDGELPSLSLGAFFDDIDWWEAKRDLGPENRGFYEPIRKGTFRGPNWPPFVTEKVFGHPYWVPADPRSIDHIIYLHGTTCHDETALVMTFSHELQHFIQYGFTRELWFLGRLISRLPKKIIDDLALNWPDVPHEREARIRAKRVGVAVCGSAAVSAYIARRIDANVTRQDVEDWRFSQQLNESEGYDLNLATRQIYHRLKPYAWEFRRLFQEAQQEDIDLDLQRIDLSAYFA